MFGIVNLNAAARAGSAHTLCVVYIVLLEPGLAGPRVSVAGITVSVAPGTSIYFTTDKAMLVYGTLGLAGSAAAHITLQPDPSNANLGAGSWGYIWFQNSATPTTLNADMSYASGSIIENVDVSNCGSGAPGACVGSGIAGLVVRGLSIDNSASAGLIFREFGNDGTAMHVVDLTVSNTVYLGVVILHRHAQLTRGTDVFGSWAISNVAGYSNPGASSVNSACAAVFTSNNLDFKTGTFTDCPTHGFSIILDYSNSPDTVVVDGVTSTRAWFRGFVLYRQYNRAPIQVRRGVSVVAAVVIADACSL